ncbi:hypothetical protein HQ529_02360 [Candidatus Woesearchaeota archaeon]|nr:hypothetical protein [Candidatus Woesearchaeota archaeon]
MNRKVLYLFFVLLLVESALGATIKGNLFDASLQPLNNVVVEVNSTPTQRVIVKEESFLFSLPIGTYKITATYETSSGILYAEEVLSVQDEGRYNLDMFLTPVSEEHGMGLEFGQKNFLKENIFLYSVILVLVIALGVFVYFHLRKKKKEEKEEQSVPEELMDIIKLLKKNKGKMTQKDIRKESPLSEAKVSLMISDLIKEQKVEKIKQGRGNIISLKK